MSLGRYLRGLLTWLACASCDDERDTSSSPREPMGGLYQ